MRSIHVGAAQIHSQAGKVRDNLARMERQVRCAAAAGVEALLLAETCLHAYDLSPETMQLAEPASGALCARVRELARACNLYIMAGFLERDGELLYNSHIVAGPAGEMFLQRKHSLTKAELDAGLTRGPRNRTLFSIKGVCCAILICADTGIEGIHEELHDQGAEYLFIPTAGGGTLAEMIHEADLALPEGRAAYEKNRPRVFKPEALIPEKERRSCGFTAANALGFDGKNACHQGHCMIVDNHFVMRAQVPGTIVLEHQQDTLIHAVLRFP